MRTIFIIVFMGAVFSTQAQIDTIKWQNKSSLPSFPRIDYASFLIDSVYYIIGGDDQSGDWTSQVWRYSIPNNSWSQLRNFPGGPITAAAGFAINGHGYICSGEDSISGYNRTNIFWEYFPEVDSWQHKINYPGVARQAPVSFVYNNFAFVGLGLGIAANDTWRYNSLSDTWDSISIFPKGPRLECATSVIDSFAYILGGFWNATAYNDIWRYDINHDRWDSLGVMPGYGRSNPLFWTFDSTIIVGYGEEEDSSGNGFMGSDIYSYDTNHNKWDSLTCVNFPDSLADGAGMGCFILGKTGFFFGGYKTYLNPTYYINMWSFDASNFFTVDTPNGIAQIRPDINFSVFPNPSHSPSFSISTSESGDVIFSDALGRVIDERRLKQGVNQIRLTTDDEVVFYHATLQYGATANGKVVFLR